jgi:hypothetical protein
MAMDRGRCLYCRSREDPHIDHIEAWRFGGLTRLGNLAVLCGPHNLVKGAYWVRPAGTVYYPHGDPANLPLAAYHRGRIAAGVSRGGAPGPVGPGVEPGLTDLAVSAV